MGRAALSRLRRSGTRDEAIDVRRFMAKTIRILSIIGALLTIAPAVRAQTPTPEGTYFVTVSAGGQPQTRTFDSSNTFTSFGETGRADTNQAVGGGFVF